MSQEEADQVKRQLLGFYYCPTCDKDIKTPLEIDIGLSKVIKGVLIKNGKAFVCCHCHNGITL